MIAAPPLVPHTATEIHRVVRIIGRPVPCLAVGRPFGCQKILIEFRAAVGYLAGAGGRAITLPLVAIPCDARHELARVDSVADVGADGIEDRTAAPNVALLHGRNRAGVSAGIMEIVIHHEEMITNFRKGQFVEAGRRIRISGNGNMIVRIGRVKDGLQLVHEKGEVVPAAGGHKLKVDIDALGAACLHFREQVVSRIGPRRGIRKKRGNIGIAELGRAQNRLGIELLGVGLDVVPRRAALPAIGIGNRSVVVDRHAEVSDMGQQIPSILVFVAVLPVGMIAEHHVARRSHPVGAGLVDLGSGRNLGCGFFLAELLHLQLVRALQNGLRAEGSGQGEGTQKGRGGSHSPERFPIR